MRTEKRPCSEENLAHVLLGVVPPGSGVGVARGGRVCSCAHSGTVNARMNINVRNHFMEQDLFECSKKLLHYTLQIGTDDIVQDPL